MNFFDYLNPNLYIAIFISILNAIVLCFVSYKSLQILQLSNYKLVGFKSWLRASTEKKGKYQLRVIFLTLASLASMLVINTAVVAMKISFYYAYIGIAVYFFFCALYIHYVYVAPKKTPLKTTNRMTRLIIALLTTYLLVSFALFYVGFSFIPYLSFALFAISASLCPVLVGVLNVIISPFENINNNSYIKKAKKKLEKDYENIIRIGITGSYGKTSCKYILSTILSQRFKVCTSPNSFNTPLGLTKVVLDYLEPTHEVLIAEMGARQKNDIAFLCDIIKPRYAITTAIGPQHIETFGSVDSIASTKGELFNSLPQNGYAVFLKDNAICKELADKCKVEHDLVSINDESCKCYAKNVTVFERGTKFTLHINDEEAECETTLLGKHNIQNILECSMLAYKLGLNASEIAGGIKNLQSIPHRLEISENGGVVIIDNSYNSSPDSSKASLECLAQFTGRKKIVITPGLVELGNLEDKYNEEFGVALAKTADFVIIVNDANKNAIVKGLGDFKNYELAKSLEDAKKLLKNHITENSVVLFENDLPDNYT